MKLFKNTSAAIGMAFLLFASILVIGASEASAETIYATTVSNVLVSFDSATPCSVTTIGRIAGLEEGEQVLGIDFRPAAPTQLYALGSSSQLYVIDTTTAVATAVGAPLSPTLEGTAFGFDFNPTVDRIRIISDTGQNLRVHPTTGAVTVDTDLNYPAGDVNAGAVPFAVGAAYTNPDNDTGQPGATGTTLYDIDAGLDILVRQFMPNAGTLNTVGSLSVRTNDLAGFDISISGTAFAALKITGRRAVQERTCGNSQLVTINLASGAATRVGYIGTRQPILGLAVSLLPQQ